MSNTFKNCLIKAIQQTPSADNSQPWLLHWKGNSLSVAYDTERVGNITFPADSPAILLSIGALIENIEQVASAFYIQFEIELSPQIDLDNPVYFTIKFKQEDLESRITMTTLPVFERHTNRFAYQAEPVNDEVLDVLKNMTSGDDAKIAVFSDKTKIMAIGQLVQKASEIRFRTREVHEWLGKSLRFGAEVEKTMDGLNVATLDLPPGGSLFLRLISNWKRMKFLNLFGTYFTMSCIDSAPVKKAPLLLAITAPSTLESILKAGQLMEKVWIDLNNQGIAVHPYYVISDQLQRRKEGLIPKGLEKQADIIYDEARQLFQLQKGETLQILLRIGYPKKKTMRSKRLPV